MSSIRFKLWSAMMSLVLVVLVLLWLFQIVFLDKFYTDMRINDVENQITAAVALLNQDKAKFADQMDRLAYENNMNIELLDLNGKTIYQSSTGINGQMMMLRNTRKEVYDTVLTGQETVIPLTHPRFGNNYVLIGLPVDQNGSMTGALILEMPLAPVEETVLILKRQLIYISLVLLAASLIISFGLARSFSRPILQINQAAEKMAQGDFSARTAISQADELGRLARTINNLGEQLGQIDQLRKDLIANVSHELRTPLSLIRGYAETLRDVTGASPEKRAKQLGIIVAETERLSGMVDDILNLSQLQSGNLKLKLSCFQLEEMIDRVARRYELLGQQKAIPLNVELGESTLVQADEARIEQVMYNLLNNAFNHVDEGGQITIRSTPNHHRIVLEVINTGPGIPTQDLPHIWDRYYKSLARLEGSTGTGLGLAIVKAVLEAHAAAFGVKQAAGKTIFWFELDRCQSA